MDNGFVLTVSQLNRYIKSIIEQDFNLQTVFVSGEISNFKRHYASGHLYMTIKDGQSQIKAVMFRSAADRLKFQPEDSMSVIIKGRVSVFERDGQYQLYIDDMQPDGAGALGVAFEQLKKKLAAEGLFDGKRKKPIPEFPERVGVITSDTGAAVRDIINVISRRCPITEIVLCPVAVQGQYAAGQIRNAIELFNLKKAADVLIVGRGGGSVEDLWAFNEEIVARAVAASEIPVISAVGHETDFTICDFAADLRAPTPSAAAELAVPDTQSLLERLNGSKYRMRTAVESRMKNSLSALRFAESRLKNLSPASYVENLSVRFDKASMAMDAAVAKRFEEKKAHFGKTCAKLEALSPLKILSRGYGIATKNGAVITDADSVEINDNIEVKLGKGALECRVTGVKG